MQNSPHQNVILTWIHKFAPCFRAKKGQSLSDASWNSWTPVQQVWLKRQIGSYVQHESLLILSHSTRFWVSYLKTNIVTSMTHCLNKHSTCFKALNLHPSQTSQRTPRDLNRSGRRSAPNCPSNLVHPTLDARMIPPRSVDTKKYSNGGIGG